MQTYKAFLKRIKNNDPALTSLKLRNTHLDLNGAAAIAEALTTNHTLVMLDLSNNEFGDDDASIAIANVLEFNKTLAKLNLANNDIYDEGAVAIATALSKNKTLTSLNLSGCELIDEDAVVIAKALSVNTSLMKFNLGRNEFSDEGIIAIILVLASNHSLRKLNLEGCELSDEGAVTFAKMLTVNTTLIKFCITGVKLSLAGLITIAKAMEDNVTLMELNLNRYQNNIFEMSIINKIRARLDRNQQATLIRRQEFVAIIVLLASDRGRRDQVTYGSLPKEIKLYILSFLHLQGKAHVGKTTQQIYQCIEFIFMCIAECLSLIKHKQKITIIENAGSKNSHSFCFFKPVLAAAPDLEVSLISNSCLFNNNRGRKQSAIARPCQDEPKTKHKKIN